MDTNERVTAGLGMILIALGVVFLIFNLVPGLNLGNAWPGIFFVLAIGLSFPPLVWPASRRALSWLLIPGSVLLVLGLIFTYQVVSDDWESWAYVWTLIPGSVGLGMFLAAWLGDWGGATRWVGVWIMVGSLLGFGAFSAIVGAPSVLTTLAPALLVAAGALLIVRSLLGGRSSLPRL